MNTTDFFTTALPTALAANADDAKTINTKYQFNIKGAGDWHVDLTAAGPICKAGVEAADCTVSVSDTDFQTLLSNPTKHAAMMVMMGKLKVSNIPAGMKLQKMLAYVK